MNTMTLTAQTESPGVYRVAPQGVTQEDEDSIIAHALAILFNRIKSGPVFDSPQAMRDYLALRHAGLQREQFDVIFLDSQHRLIECETLFVGTLTQTSVYPREVVKRCLELNASAVVLAHNHPSGKAEASTADIHLTQTLKSALSLVDVRVLDHFVTGGDRAISMAERGQV